MTLYKPLSSPAQMAQSAMSAATQAAAAQTKQTTTTVKKESNVWDDIYKGAVSLAAVGRGIDSLVGAADSAWSLYNEHKLRSAYDDVSKAFGEGGFESIQRNPDMQDYWHAQAVGQFVKDRASTEKGRLEMLKNMDAAADKLYQDWRIQAARTEEAWKAGNMQQFIPFMQQLSNITPGPYRLIPGEDGTFKVLFRSDQHHGEFVETGQTLTHQQTVDMMRAVRNGEVYTLKGIDGKLHPSNPIFGAQATRSWWGTVIGNAEISSDPGKQLLLYRNNQPYAVAMLQNSHEDPMKRGQYKVFALNDGRSLGIADGVPGLLQRGLSPFAPQKQKGGGSGSGGYKLTDGDRSALRKAFTIVNEKTGEESIQHEMVADLESFMRRTGLSVDAALATLQTNTELALKAGAPDLPAARKIAIDAMQNRPLPRLPKKDTPDSPQDTTGTAKAATADRIRNAAAGNATTQPSVAQGIGGLHSPVARQIAPRGSLNDTEMLMGGQLRAGFERQRSTLQDQIANEEKFSQAMESFYSDPAAYGKGAFDRKTNGDAVSSYYAARRAAADAEANLRAQEQIERMRMRGIGYY